MRSACLAIAAVLPLGGCSGVAPLPDPCDTITVSPGFASPIDLPTGVVVIDDVAFDVEIAATPASRNQGLMGRDEVPSGSGMLFILDASQSISFWMLDTPTALDIAFIRADGVVVGVDTMEPFTTDLHPSPEPVLYALEIAAGELADKGIEVGSAISHLCTEQ